MLDAVFCYGTLQLQEVFEHVTGRRLPRQSACARGFRRRALRGECFPGVVPVAGDTTCGVVYRGLSREHLARLDRFEADYYHRRALNVETATGERFKAWGYVLKPRNAVLLADRDWDLEEFRRQHLPRFLARR